VAGTLGKQNVTHPATFCFQSQFALFSLSIKAECASEGDTNQSGKLYFRPNYALFSHFRPQIAFLAQQILSLNSSDYRPSYAFFGGQ
jgi:hypothetical protein